MTLIKDGQLADVKALLTTARPRSGVFHASLAQADASA
jgi:hypothetical protein